MTHYIYLPGLGDKFDGLRLWALRRWKDSEAKVTFVPMNWDNKKEPWQQKYDRVKAALTDVEGENVVLIGESAGGSMAVYSLAQSRAGDFRVITICGYNHGAAAMHISHKTKHPALYRFMPFVDEAVQNLDDDQRQRLTTIISTKDRIVKPEHSKIIGARIVLRHSGSHQQNIMKILWNPKKNLEI